ncbi:MAG: transferase, partial [Chloroflexota bacterium]
MSGTTANGGIRLYLSRQAASLPRYILEQMLFALVGWVPTIIGI